ncbi:MAG: copper homeostasis protein CutC [Syntrophothermus sp.]
MIFEACVNSARSAAEAWKGGADRVELCENMTDGGCTPSAGSIILAKQLLPIPVYVMIRPRGGDFLYTPEEFQVMREDIKMARSLGADGIVTGILNADGTVDRPRMAELVCLARPMGITFHRAFDMTNDPFRAMEDIIELGIERILTSGQSDSAIDGSLIIRKLIDQAKGRVIIMPGHGIKEYNITEAINSTGANEFHLYLPSAMGSNMKYVREYVKMGTSPLSEYKSVIIDQEKIRVAKNRMDQS